MLPTHYNYFEISKSMLKKRVKVLTEALSLKRSLLGTPGDRIQEQMYYSRFCYKQVRRVLSLKNSEVKKLLAGKLRISVDLAIRLQRIFGIDASFWLNLEQHYQHELLEIAKMEAELHNLFELTKFYEINTLKDK